MFTLLVSYAQQTISEDVCWRQTKHIVKLLIFFQKCVFPCIDLYIYDMFSSEKLFLQSVPGNQLCEEFDFIGSDVVNKIGKKLVLT